jgi:hypothetical protein
MYTKDACAVPGGAYAQGTVQLLEVSTPQWPELHMDMSTIKRIVLLLQMSTSQGPKLHLDVSTVHYRGMCYTGRCLHHRGLSCIWDMSTLQGPELHQDILKLQSPVLLCFRLFWE